MKTVIRNAEKTIANVQLYINAKIWNNDICNEVAYMTSLLETESEDEYEKQCNCTNTFSKMYYKAKNNSNLADEYIVKLETKYGELTDITIK